MLKQEILKGENKKLKIIEKCQIVQKPVKNQRIISEVTKYI
jgi:hypothetical protein